MPRPKKAPVKRTRKPKEPENRDVPSSVPPSWIDEQLRKECLQIAANNGSSIGTLVRDSQEIYGFIKGGISYSGVMEFTPPEQREGAKHTSGYIYRAPIGGEGESLPESTLTTFPKSKLDAHTL